MHEFHTNYTSTQMKIPFSFGITVAFITVTACSGVTNDEYCTEFIGHNLAMVEESI